MGRIWSGNNRAPWHDYSSRHIYHITLMKRPEVMPFGALAGDWRIKPGNPGCSYIKASPLGSIIKSCLREFSTINPNLKICQYALMPDHLHLIIFAENRLDEILGRKLAAFKVMVNRRAQIDSVFAKGFNDQILTTTRNLNVIYSYLRENPRRLAIRRAQPDFFSKVNSLLIGNLQCQAYGNMHLLANPFKEQVVIHRADSGEKRKSLRDTWLHCGGNGGVLVSPFISPAEKAIRSEAEELGAKVILITHEAFGERFKPAAHDFDLCSDGRLLILSLGLPQGTLLTRNLCLRMNALAQTVCTQIFVQGASFSEPS